MLQEGTYKGDYSIYSLDSLEQWVAEFKGLYIVPAVDQTSPNKGNILRHVARRFGLCDLRA